MNNKETNSSLSILPNVRRIRNKEIIKALPHLRNTSKDYALREKYLDSKSKALVKLGGVIKDSRSRASEICIQVLLRS